MEERVTVPGEEGRKGRDARDAGNARDRFDRKDIRLIGVCLLVIGVSAAVGLAGFSKAFPEASIDFKVTREDARRSAEKALTERGFDLEGFKSLVVFDHDDEAKVYLERTLGLEKANPLFGEAVPVWRWSIRWIKPLQKLEYLASVSPSGRLLAFRRLLAEREPSADAGETEARRLAEETLKSMRGLDPAGLRFIEATSERRPARMDRTFVWESNSSRWGDGALRYLVEIQGNQVGRSSLYLKVPEKWSEEYRILRSKNEAMGAAATLGLFFTAVAILCVFVERARRKDIRWRWALAFGVVGLTLKLASSLNELPLTLFDYRTQETWGGFLAKALLGDLGGALLLGMIVALLVAAGEPLYREAYPGKPALGRIFSRRGIQTKKFFSGVLLGYALTAFFFAYQVVFYLGAAKLGAWAPADIPYSNLLGTSFPWLSVLLMGFMPATTEEFSSRMFSIPFAQRFVPTWAAVLIPALIWGFAHSAYPNQPFYIRGVEVGLAGIVIGALMLKTGILPLLVWHFTVDALYTSLILIRSSNPYFVVSGAAAAGALLLPMLVSLFLYAHSGGFLPEADITNRAVGTALPAGGSPIPLPREFSPSPPLPRRWVWGILFVAAALLAVSQRFLPLASIGKGTEYRVGRGEARRLADDFLKKSGDNPSSFLAVVESASALPALERGSESDTDMIPYDWSRKAERWLVQTGGLALLNRWAGGVLPGRVWQVRYLRPEDRHGWWVVVDGRSGRISGFRRTLPEEEAGGSLGDGPAREKALDSLRSFGLDPEGFSVVSAKREARKARSDHRILFESKTDTAGEAKRWVAVGIAGERPSLLATALKLPEEWVRAREKWTASTYLGLAWKVLGLGTLIGLILLELIGAARRGEIPWGQAARYAVPLALPSILLQIVSLPLALTRFPEDASISLETFSVFLAIGLVIGAVISYGLALLPLSFVLTVRPDAPLAVRKGTSDGKRALVAAALTVLAVVTARSLRENLAAFWPVASGFGRLPVPPGVDTVLPALDVLASSVRFVLLLAGSVALCRLLLTGVLRPLRVRIVALVVLLGAIVPLSARTPGEVFIPLLGSLLALSALAGSVIWLLRGDPLAYLLTGLLVGASRGGLDLLASDIASWRLNGAVFLIGTAAILIWVGLVRREPKGPEAAVEPMGSGESPV